MPNEKQKILIVDDEPVNLHFLEKQLETANYHVLKATNGNKAIEVALGPLKPDLILLDVMMPGMSGFEVAEKIRKVYPLNELPIIMLTVKNQESDLINGFDSGANDYITKPFSKNELLARLKIHIGLCKINRACSRFIPKQFFNFLGRASIIDVKLGDHVRKHLTIMFTDIRSFTTLSEKMTPDQSFKFLNSYLSYMGPVIRDKNGFIDKYVGDGIMALFADNPEDAIKAAIETMKTLKKFNNIQKNKNEEPIKIGIGINTGKVMLGIIGESQRIDGTVISDTVNTASRLEGLTKLFGQSIIFSENTRKKVKNINAYNYRFLGKVKTKGKNIPVYIYDLFDGQAEDIIEKKNQTKQDFEKALMLFLDKKFSEATLLFRHVLDKNPDDKAAKHYLKRSAYYILNEPPEDWDVVEDIEHK